MLQERDKQIAKSIEAFGDSLPSIQKEIYSKLIDIISEMPVDKDGKIKPSKANLVAIGRAKIIIKKILRGSYKSSVNSLIESWSLAEKETNKYFKELAKH